LEYHFWSKRLCPVTGNIEREKYGKYTYGEEINKNFGVLYAHKYSTF
jgi:ubiquinone/menaquinone biosynthesis C-methylase UbiE